MAACFVATHSCAQSDGRVRLDSLGPGLLFVRARAIGFLPLGDTVRVRAGFVDTLEVQMRTDVGCLQE
jgi:hypothetical protein